MDEIIEDEISVDEERINEKENPRETANPFSILFWWWTLDLFKKGYKKVLGVEDLLDPLTSDRSNYLGVKLETQWNRDLEECKKKKQKPSLLKTIFKTFAAEYFVLGVIQVLNEFVLRLGTPMILGALLRYFKRDGTVTYTSALYLAGGICLSNAINAISINQAIFGAFHIGGRIRVAVCSLLYRKAMKLSTTALGETAPGKVVNLMANDVNRFDLVSIFIHHMWSAPLSALIIAYFMYNEASYAGLIGIGAVFIVVPIQAYTGKLSSKYRYRTAIKTDERVRLMDEIVSGVQVIKMYGWEKSFCSLVQKAREFELKEVRKSSYIRGIYMTFNLFTTRLALFCTLLTMVASSQQLTVDKVFVFLAYFNILAQTMSGMFVRGFAELAECMVAVRRLQNFLYFDEYKGKSNRVTTYDPDSSEIDSDEEFNDLRERKYNLIYNKLYMKKVEEERAKIAAAKARDKNNKDDGDDKKDKDVEKGAISENTDGDKDDKDVENQAIYENTDDNKNDKDVENQAIYENTNDDKEDKVVENETIYENTNDDKKDKVVENEALYENANDETIYENTNDDKKDKVVENEALYENANDVKNDDVKNEVIYENEITNKTKTEEQNSSNNTTDNATPDGAVVTTENPPEPETWVVKLENFTAKWESSLPENTLDNINIEFERGKLYMVIGMVGSGKSSLLSAILGELTPDEGDMKISCSLSYASQEAWVIGGTVRQNILFRERYNRRKYQRVIKACSLQRDFKQFPRGDHTMIGERGSSLSGGQKARINLARCVYRQADMYLLDDPLSAVDAHVSKHLFNECIKDLLAEKTTIIATHQLQYIKDVDGIILLEQGKCRYFPNYLDLLTVHPEYSVLIAADSERETAEETKIEKQIRRRFSTSSNRSRTPDGGDTDIEEEEELSEEINGNIESTSKGTVTGSIFMKYFQSGGNLGYAFTVFMLYIFTQCTASLNDIYVQRLVNIEEIRYKNAALENNSLYNHPMLEDKGNYTAENITSFNPELLELPSQNSLMFIYGSIVCSIFVVAITRSCAFYTLCVRCSQRLHDMAFGALIKTGMRFYETNPSGRILNRFSKDMGAIDELLPKAMLDAGQIILTMVGALVVSCIVNPLFLIPIAVITFIFYWIRKVYLKTSKNIKRLEGMTRSPVFTLMSSTLNGLSTIRAHDAEIMLQFEFDKCQDLHTSSWFMFISTSTAFGFSLDIFCFIFTTLVTFSFLLLTSDSVTGGEVGLAITQVMALTGIIQWGMRQAAEVTNQLMSVERVLEYTLLPPEPNIRKPAITPKKKEQKTDVIELKEIPMNWPSQGQITFTNVFMKYSDQDQPVLKDLNLVIQPGEKIGIVGRTGAGKSSLISALFRLASVEGVIEIDGIDTGSIYVEDLRKHISIIPQDPVLFSGTLRKNLDPFNEYSDVELWSALDEVELKDTVTSTGNGLEGRVFDRGSNFSVGQRQLVCLARAILRNNRILLLDEATANVDPQTDALIQKTIRIKFSSCTVLTVAHRLNTIMDSDKVLIMNKGRMVEFDHPHVLLSKQKSEFKSLVKKTGHAMYDKLARIAKEDYKARKK